MFLCSVAYPGTSARAGIRSGGAMQLAWLKAVDVVV